MGWRVTYQYCRLGCFLPWIAQSRVDRDAHDCCMHATAMPAHIMQVLRLSCNSVVSARDIRRPGGIGLIDHGLGIRLHLRMYLSSTNIFLQPFTSTTVSFDNHAILGIPVSLFFVHS